MLDYLGQVDLGRVLNIPPSELEKRPGLLELPQDTWLEQRNAGTWSDIFQRDAIQNQNAFVGVLVWYFFITLLGLVTFPLTRIVFKGLHLKGWGLSRLLALILLSYFVWLCGSIGIPVTRLLIFIIILVLVGINIFLAIGEKENIIGELRENWRNILTLEFVFFALFLIFLLIRAGNPDLWHPYKGGEKPMDFSYFNAVIKSKTFPPYDPWYAGGYINYYYWGFLLAAVPTKFLGIIPATAYNLTLPTFFAMTGAAAFTIGVNLNKHRPNKWLLAGLISTGLVLFIGNLGTIKMIFQGFQQLGEGQAGLGSGDGFTNIKILIAGIREYLKYGRFNFYPGDWYWIPSRAIPGEPITEFPFFTFLYGDPHAHLFAYPITLVCVSWALSTLHQQWKYANRFQMALSLMLGALLVGSLRPTNTWDLPVFLVISGFSIVYTYIKYGEGGIRIFPKKEKQPAKVFTAFILLLFFIMVSLALFSPYSKWYGQAYTSFSLWEGDTTPLGAYLSHWGIFLFIIISWLATVTSQWMKLTPLSRVYDWRENLGIILSVVLLLIAFWAYLIFQGVVVSVIVIPMVVWALLLAFRKDITEGERVVLLLVCMGLALTLVVELIVLAGDIGRMNTVFKFYLQAWTCIALAAGYGLFSLVISRKDQKKTDWSSAWQTILALLLLSGSLYPFFATTDKVADRISPETPFTLDGMAYMQYAEYPESNMMMDLEQDYQLIRWMQDNIPGTPRIMEANIPEYRWGSRISIYTGLPSVIGWNWHQRQQRAINPGDWIFGRVEDVSAFYSTTDWKEVRHLIERYQIDYVVIGQLERIVYPADGINKFLNAPEELFNIVYSAEDTVLLKVNRGFYE